MSSSNKVGEIFTSAGEAFNRLGKHTMLTMFAISTMFNRLGELTMQLQGNQGSSGASAAKWTDEEVSINLKIQHKIAFFQVEMLHRAVRNFSQDLQVESSTSVENMEAQSQS